MTGLAIGLGLWFGLWALGNGIRRGLAVIALAMSAQTGGDKT